MSLSSAFVSILLFLVILSTLLNVATIIYFFTKLKGAILTNHLKVIEDSISNNKDKESILAQQDLILESAIVQNSSRIEYLEKVISILMMGPGGPSDLEN